MRERCRQLVHRTKIKESYVLGGKQIEDAARSGKARAADGAVAWAAGIAASGATVGATTRGTGGATARGTGGATATAHLQNAMLQ